MVRRVLVLFGRTRAVLAIVLPASCSAHARVVATIRRIDWYARRVAARLGSEANVLLAVWSEGVCWTLAFVGRNTSHNALSRPTVDSLARVYFRLTVDAGVSRVTSAIIGVNEIVAFAVRIAWAAGAFVDFILASRTKEAVLTGARVVP